MRLAHITYFGFVWMASGLVACYLTSLFYGNHDPASVPMISDTASRPPGGGLVAIVLNWFCFCTLLQAYIFYRYIIAIRGQSNTNKLALFASIVQAVGGSIAGCFEVRQSYGLHQVGSTLTLVGGFTYCVLAMSLLIELSKTHNRRSKTFLSAVRWSSLITQAVTSYIFTKGVIFDNVLTHPTSTAEWIMVYSFMIFILTISDELVHIRDIEICLVKDSRVLSNGVHKKIK